jgi:hypothetical protein
MCLSSEQIISIVTRLWAGVSGNKDLIHLGAGVFLFAMASSSDLGSTQLLVQRILRALSKVVLTTHMPKIKRVEL